MLNKEPSGGLAYVAYIDGGWSDGRRVALEILLDDPHVRPNAIPTGLYAELAEMSTVGMSREARAKWQRLLEALRRLAAVGVPHCPLTVSEWEAWRREHPEVEVELLPMMVEEEVKSSR